MSLSERHRAAPLVAVTTGDPAGVGPEIVAHLFSRYEPERSRAVLVGALHVMTPWFERFGLRCPAVTDAGDLAAATTAASARVVLLDTGVADEVPVGVDSAGGGRHAGRAIEVACELVNNRAVSAVVTAPISKKSLNSGGFHYSGHTEMLARYLNSPHCQMMMVHENLRVVPLTRHLSIRDVPARITKEDIVMCMDEVDRALREDFGVDSPRIAVAGLNPHAGDGGVIGREELDVIAPALEELRARGLHVDGPLSADAMFQAAAEAHAVGAAAGAGKRGYDAYVSMYHDQGLVPFKMLAQRRGVNVTIGLPVPRTSVDHGTAYDIAGRGIAETGSLRAAYTLAEELIR